MWKLPKFRKSAPKREAKSLALGTSAALGSFLIFGQHGAATASGALSLYDGSTAVSIPINMVAEAFASIEPVVKREGKIELDHPVLDLLRKPSPFFTQDLFLETIAKHYLITANAYIIALGNLNRPPLELQPINPNNVNTREGDQGFVKDFVVSGRSLAGSYKINKNRNRISYIGGNLRELKQIRGFSIRDNALLQGRSLLASASAEVRQHILGNTHNVSILEKGGHVSLIFHFDEDLGTDDFEETKMRVRAQYGGASKAGEIGVTAGGKLDIKEIGTTNKDMDFANLQSLAKQAVALQYKVPLPLITIEGATFNNFATAWLALYDNAVLPLADRVFSGLSDLLMPRYGDDPAVAQITYDMDTITALAGRRNEELKLRRDLNLETLNELRAAIGREPVLGGDEILAPATMVPIGTDLFTSDNDPVQSVDSGLEIDEE